MASLIASLRGEKFAMSLGSGANATRRSLPPLPDLVLLLRPKDCDFSIDGGLTLAFLESCFLSILVPVIKSDDDLVEDTNGDPGLEMSICFLSLA